MGVPLRELKNMNKHENRKLELLSRRINNFLSCPPEKRKRDNGRRIALEQEGL